VPAAVQVVPSSVEKNTSPSNVPVKGFAPAAEKAETPESVSPLFAATQLVPLFVERKTPRLSVPEKIFLPLTAKCLLSPLEVPLVCTH
jgi:hypothetical protein